MKSCLSNVSYRGGATTTREASSSARFFRSQFGSDERKSVVKYVIVVEVPSMAEHHEHDSDPEFQEFDRLADAFQPEGPLVFGGDLIHSVG